MLLLAAFHQLYLCDDRYKLWIGGAMQDKRYKHWMEHYIKMNELHLNVKYDGFIQDRNKWFRNKNYIICTSPWESQNMSVMEAMASGIKPAIHWFPGADKIYPQEYLWKNIDEFIDIIISTEYDSIEYREAIQRYNLHDQVKQMQKVFGVKNDKGK